MISLPTVSRLTGSLLLLASLVLPSAGIAQGSAAPAQRQRLTLGEAVGFALEKNPDLRQAANQVASGTLTVAQRRADFAPDLGLTLAGTERHDQAVAADGDRSGRSYETVSGALGSNFNLFNGFGDVAALRGAQSELSGVRSRYTREEQSLVFATVSAFLQTLSDRELIRVRAENLEGNRRQLEQVDALYRAGNRPVSDLYQQQAETAGAELDLLVAERSFAVAARQLLQTLGLPPTGGVELQAPDLAPLEAALVARDQAPPDPAALAQRADLQAAAQQLAAAGEQVSEARAGYWPTLNLAASLGSDYSSLLADGFSGQFFDDHVGNAVGLTLTVPIFDRQLARHQVAQARIRQDNARLDLYRQQLQAEAESGQAVDDFHTAQQLLGVTEARLTAARQALAAMEERYRVGAATLVELTQARTSFTTAAYERVKARFGLITQGVAVAYYQGDGEGLRDLLDRWENAQ